MLREVDGFGPAFMDTLERYLHKLKEGTRMRFQDREMLYFIQLRILSKKAEQKVSEEIDGPCEREI